MRGLIAAAAAIAVLAGVATAENLFGPGGMTIEEVAAILESEGLDANLRDGGEAGRIESDVSGGLFEILSVNCNTEGRCTEFLFIAGFDLANGFELEKINEWNAESLGGRAFLDDENDPFLDHVISVSGPGDSGAFREGLYLWAAAMEEFLDFIELPEASAEA